MDCSHEGLANDIISECTKNSRKSRQVKVVWRESRVSYDKHIEKVGLGGNSVPKRVLIPKFVAKLPLTKGGGGISPTPYRCGRESPVGDSSKSESTEGVLIIFRLEGLGAKSSLEPTIDRSAAG
jgi:hypothetical protein